MIAGRALRMMADHAALEDLPPVQSAEAPPRSQVTERDLAAFLTREYPRPDVDPAVCAADALRVLRQPLRDHGLGPVPCAFCRLDKSPKQIVSGLGGFVCSHCCGDAVQLVEDQRRAGA